MRETRNLDAHPEQGTTMPMPRDIRGTTKRRLVWMLCLLLPLLSGSTAFAQEPDLIFRKSTTFRLLTPNDKLATYGIDDPIVQNVSCHYTLPERGGVAGALGVAEQVSDVSLSCGQTGPISFKEKFAQGDVVFQQSRSLLFKKVQIVRGCDEKRNVLVYLIYSDKLVDGSPKNSTSSVAIMPWGTAGDVPKCTEWLKK
jgi:CreA protein